MWKYVEHMSRKQKLHMHFWAKVDFTNINVMACVRLFLGTHSAAFTHDNLTDYLGRVSKLIPLLFTDDSNWSTLVLPPSGLPPINRPRSASASPSALEFWATDALSSPDRPNRCSKGSTFFENSGPILKESAWWMWTHTPKHRYNVLTDANVC